MVTLQATPSVVVTGSPAPDPTQDVTVTVSDQDPPQDQALIVDVLPTSNVRPILSAVWISSTAIALAHPDEFGVSWSTYDIESQAIDQLPTSPLLGSNIYTTLGIDEPVGLMKVSEFNAEIAGLIAPSGERALSWRQFGDCTGPDGRTEIMMHSLDRQAEPKQAEIETCGVLTRASWTHDENAVILGLVMEFGEALYLWDFNSGAFEGVLTQPGEVAITEYGWAFDPKHSRLALITLDLDLQLISPFSETVDSAIVARQITGVPAFSSDGQSIFFWQRQGDGDGDVPLRLIQLDLVSGGLRVLISDNPEWEVGVFGERRIAPSADNRLVALYGYGLSIVEVP